MDLEIINSSNVTRLEELYTLQTSSSVYSLAFSPNSSILAIGRDDNIELWQVANGSLLGSLPFGWTGGKGEFAFHPTGNTVVAVSGNIVKFSLWDATARTKIKDVLIPSGHQPGCVAITPTGQTIATGGADGQIFFWSWNKGDPIFRSPMTAHSQTIDSLAFSPDGLYLASGAKDGFLRLWRVGFDLVPQLHAEVPITGANLNFPQLSFNNLGTMLVAANRAGNILYLLNVGDGTVAELSLPMSPTTDQMLDGTFSPIEQLIASCQGYSPTGETLFEFWDSSTQTLLLEKPLMCDMLKFSPDGRVLAIIYLNPNGPVTPSIWGIKPRLMKVRDEQLLYILTQV